MDDVRQHRWKAAAIILLIGIVIGVLVGRTLAPDLGPEQPETSEGTAPDGDPGPSGLRNGVPVGYAQSQDGAIAAATAFAKVMSAATADLEAYRLAMETIAAPEWKARARELAISGVRFVRDRYGDQGVLTFVPVRYRVADYSGARARIEIWGVTLGQGPKVEGIEESWVTGAVELTWSGDWRVTGGTSQSGPTPELLQTEVGAPFSILEGFQEYFGAPTP